MDRLDIPHVADTLARTQALRKALCGRVDRLTEAVNSRRNLYPVGDRAADVAEDVAYSGEDMER